MISATLDPRVFAAPPPTAVADDFRAFIISLTNWSKLADEPLARLWVSSKTAQCLFDDGRYPLPLAMRDAMRACGVIEYDLNTVKRVVERLLQMTPSFEEHCSFNDVLHSDMSTEPEVLSPGNSPSLSGDAGRCLLILAVLSRYRTRLLDAHRFATPRLTQNSTIRVRARLEIADHSRPDLQDLPALPASIDAHVNGCPNFDAFLAGLDAAQLFLAAQNEEQTRFAIRVNLHQSRLQRGITSDWFQQPDILLGTQFRERALQCCGADINLARLLLQSCAEVLDRFNLQRGHPIRTSSGGGAPQLRINGHGAQRHNISAVYHLHYWERTDGRMELAWVSYPHDDMTTPQPQ